MAENKRSASSGQTKKTTAAKPKPKATATARATVPARKASDSKNAKPAKKTKQSSEDKRREAEELRLEEERRAARAARRESFSKQFLPYILGGISLFLAVSLIADAVSGDATAAEHAMGYLGYYLCRGLFGMLGFVAYLIPLVLVTLTVFWRRYYRTGRVVGKVILSAVLLVLLSAVGHVFLCEGSELIAGMYQPGQLFRTGAAFESGGVIGGLVGYVLYLAIRLPGTIVLAVVTLPLIIMCLLGVTPGDVFGRMWAGIKARRAARADDDAREEAKSKKKTPVKQSYRARREAKRAREADDDAYDDVYDEEDEPLCEENAEDEEPLQPAAKGDRSSTRKKPRRIVRVDADTGETLDDEDEDEDELEEAPASRKRKAAKVAKAEKRSKSPDVDEEEEEDYATPPLHEPRASHPVADAYDRAARDTELDDRGDRDERNERNERDREEVSTVEIMAAERLPGAGRSPERARSAAASAPAAPAARAAAPAEEDSSLPWRESEDDVPADAGELDAMEVDLDEDVPEAPARHVHVEVVREADAPAPKRSAEPVTVRILQTEAGAVAERGLSEEELVLPSGHSADPENPGTPDVDPVREYQFPSVEMLTRGSGRYEANENEIAENTETLREVLESFHIRVKEISCSCGPTITRFEVKPDAGVRVRSIANLVDDIAMNLAKAGVRIEAPIPGKNAVGIEVPNSNPSTVHLRNILETPEFRNHKSRIAACLGADVSGRPVIMDINKMPHLLIAGATGMGKSVCINSIIMSILYKARPDEVKLILIDPKKVEFAMYRDLPHLYAPIVSDPKKAAGALNSAVNEMERRFELIEEVGVRNLAGYNEITAGDPERPPLPQMVIIIDELADLMMTAPADVETAICRLAQKARAAGIHLIIGTQRPSVDVITGLIKANIPSRIAFTVASSVDSRTIIDTVGADKLIGRGDMLYAPVGANKPMRAQGTLVSETEVERVVTFIKENNEPPVYNEDFTRNIDIEAAKCGSKKKGGDADDFAAIGGRNDGEDPKFWEALEIVVTKEKIGTSALQRGCNLGYGRAAKIIDRMEALGFIGPDDGTKQGRKVYITKQNLMEYKLNGLPGSGSEDGDDSAE